MTLKNQTLTLKVWFSTYFLFIGYLLIGRDIGTCTVNDLAKKYK